MHSAQNRMFTLHWFTFEVPSSSLVHKQEPQTPYSSLNRACLVWLCSTGSQFVFMWLCWDCWLSSLLVPLVSAGPSGFCWSLQFLLAVWEANGESCCEWMDFVKSFSVWSPPHFVNLFPSWLTHCISATVICSPCIRFCRWLPSATACNNIFWF